MLKSLDAKNVTVFRALSMRFGKALNVIVGENGAGKSHVLKLAYAAASVCAWGEKQSVSAKPTREFLKGAIARKLVGVFRPDVLGRLVTRGEQRAEVSAEFETQAVRITFTWDDSSTEEVAVREIPKRWLPQWPVFLPTRELLSIYPGFVSLYETTEIPFEETWRDTCILLARPLLKESQHPGLEFLLRPLEEQLGGRVQLTGGRFVLRLGRDRTEAPLLAEGLRKLATIAHLIATGSLEQSTTLFWDEPEANLNPKVIKQVARTILELCANGVQVVLASHSLFLIRELDILLEKDEYADVRTRSRFFGLHRRERGVEVEQGRSIDDIGKIDALEEELSQSDRYLTTGSP